MIRALQATDIERVGAICMAAFMTSVATSLSPQGVDTFRALATVEAIARRMHNDNVMRVFEDDGGLKGYAELKQGRHVAMLFVDPASQRQGVGAALMAALLAQVREPMVTVSASLGSVGAYERYGFACAGDVAESSGLVYQPMQLLMPNHLSQVR